MLHVHVDHRSSRTLRAPGAHWLLLRLVLLLLRRFGVDGLLVPLGSGLQLGRVVLRSLVPYALDELAARGVLCSISAF